MDSSDATYNQHTSQWELRVTGPGNAIIFAESRDEIAALLLHVAELQSEEGEEKLTKKGLPK